MKRRGVRIALAGAAVGLVAVVGCADLLGFKDLKTPIDDAAVDAPSGDAGDAAPDVYECNHTRWPTSSDAGTPVDDAGNYIVALAHMYFSSLPDGGTPTFGYDLDDRCTHDNDPATASCTSTNVINDGPNDGVDNASITIMSELSKQSFGTTLTDTAINANIAAGNFSLLLHLNGYGGGTDQSRTTGLQVAVQGVTGIESPATPNFDGNDRWIVDVDDSISSGTNTPKVFYPADVVGGLLVSTFNSQPVTLHVLVPQGVFGGVLNITLRTPVLTAHIVKRSDGSFDLTNGVIAGRWAAADLISSLAGLDVFGSAFCTYFDGGAIDTAKKSYICPFLDITALGPDDNTHACDAIAVAVAFDAVSAQIATNPGNFSTPATPCPFDAGGCN